MRSTHTPKLRGVCVVAAVVGVLLACCSRPTAAATFAIHLVSKTYSLADVDDLDAAVMEGFADLRYKDAFLAFQLRQQALNLTKNAMCRAGACSCALVKVGTLLAEMRTRQREANSMYEKLRHFGSDFEASVAHVQREVAGPHLAGYAGLLARYAGDIDGWTREVEHLIAAFGMRRQPKLHCPLSHESEYSMGVVELLENTLGSGYAGIYARPYPEKLGWFNRILDFVVSEKNNNSSSSFAEVPCGKKVLEAQHVTVDVGYVPQTVTVGQTVYVHLMARASGGSTEASSANITYWARLVGPAVVPAVHHPHTYPGHAVLSFPIHDPGEYKLHVYTLWLNEGFSVREDPDALYLGSMFDVRSTLSLNAQKFDPKIVSRACQDQSLVGGPYTIVARDTATPSLTYPRSPLPVCVGRAGPGRWVSMRVEDMYYGDCDYDDERRCALKWFTRFDQSVETKPGERLVWQPVNCGFALVPPSVVASSLEAQNIRTIVFIGLSLSRELYLAFIEFLNPELKPTHVDLDLPGHLPGHDASHSWVEFENTRIFNLGLYVQLWGDLERGHMSEHETYLWEAAMSEPDLGVLVVSPPVVTWAMRYSLDTLKVHMQDWLVLFLKYRDTLRKQGTRLLLIAGPANGVGPLYPGQTLMRAKSFFDHVSYVLESVGFEVIDTWSLSVAFPEEQLDLTHISNTHLIRTTVNVLVNYMCFPPYTQQQQQQQQQRRQEAIAFVPQLHKGDEQTKRIYDLRRQTRSLFDFPVLVADVQAPSVQVAQVTIVAGVRVEVPMQLVQNSRHIFTVDAEAITPSVPQQMFLRCLVEVLPRDDRVVVLHVGIDAHLMIFAALLSPNITVLIMTFPEELQPLMELLELHQTALHSRVFFAEIARDARVSDVEIASLLEDADVDHITFIHIASPSTPSARLFAALASFAVRSNAFVCTLSEQSDWTNIFEAVGVQLTSTFGQYCFMFYPSADQAMDFEERLSSCRSEDYDDGE